MIFELVEMTWLTAADTKGEPVRTSGNTAPERYFA